MIDSIKTILHVGSDVPENQPLPEYAILYFEHLAGEYGSIPATKINDEVGSIVGKIFEKEPKETYMEGSLYL